MKKELHELQKKLKETEKIINACIAEVSEVYKLYTDFDGYVFGSDRNKDSEITNIIIRHAQKKLAETIKNILFN